MTTDLQLARRFEPEAGRFSSSPQQLAGIQPTAAMDSSDDEFSLQDAPDATLRENTFPLLVHSDREQHAAN